MSVFWRVFAAALFISLFQQAAIAAELRVLSIPGIKAALEELKQFTDSVKILGCYPQAKA